MPGWDMARMQRCSLCDGHLAVDQATLKAHHDFRRCVDAVVSEQKVIQAVCSIVDAAERVEKAVQP